MGWLNVLTNFYPNYSGREIASDGQTPAHVPHSVHTSGDCSYGALIDTCSTCDAVFTNYVSHNVFVLLLILMFLYNTVDVFLPCKDNHNFGISSFLGIKTCGG